MKPHCGYCCAHKGRIVVGLDHITNSVQHTNPAKDCPGCFEMYGPCPFCDDGREFEYSDTGRSLWGPDGFWKGITPKPADVAETCRCYERPLGREASIQRLAELTEKTKAYLADQRAGKTTVPRHVSVSQMTSTSEVKPRGVAENGTQPVSNDDEIGTLL